MIDHEAWFPGVAFVLGAAVGLADLLRSKRGLTVRTVLAALLWHGLGSMGAALVLADQVGNRLLLYGVSIASASGAFSLADILAAGVRAKILPPK